MFGNLHKCPTKVLPWKSTHTGMIYFFKCISLYYIIVEVLPNYIPIPVSSLYVERSVHICTHWWGSSPVLQLQSAAMLHMAVFVNIECTHNLFIHNCWLLLLLPANQTENDTLKYTLFEIHGKISYSIYFSSWLRLCICH